MTHANHRERQSMQHQRGVGWMNAITLPSSQTVLEALDVGEDNELLEMLDVGRALAK
jgi:hypothetical protein